MMTPEVSVIIPTYNRSSYLRQAVESVLRQTFTDFEAIVVDDGSTDGTGTMIKTLNDSRIRYEYQTNQGRSVARNNGVDLSQGLYIAFLDDDDLFLPNKLQIQVNALRENPDVGSVASGFTYIDECNRLIHIARPWLLSHELTVHGFLYEPALLHLASTLFRRDSLSNLGKCFDHSFHLGEDTDFFLRMFLSGIKISWMPTIVASYRLHETGTMSQTEANAYSHAVKRLLDKFFRHPGISQELLLERERIYAFHQIVSACRAYGFCQTSYAQQLLEGVLEEFPEWEETTFLDLVSRCAGFPQNDPRSFINFVFDHLPPGLSHLEKHRKECFRRFLQRVAKAGSYGEGPLKELASKQISDPERIRIGE